MSLLLKYALDTSSQRTLVLTALRACANTLHWNSYVGVGSWAAPCSSYVKTIGLLTLSRGAAPISVIVLKLLNPKKVLFPPIIFSVCVAFFKQITFVVKPKFAYDKLATCCHWTHICIYIYISYILLPLLVLLLPFW